MSPHASCPEIRAGPGQARAQAEPGALKGSADIDVIGFVSGLPARLNHGFLPDEPPVATISRRGLPLTLSRLMAFSIKGFGTKFIGEGDPRLDGSFVTTEFVVLLNVPVLPLRSFRLIRTGAGSELLAETNFFTIVEKLPIQWLQVMRIYLLILVVGAWMISYFWFFGGTFNQLGLVSVTEGILRLVSFFGFLIGPPYAVQWWYRRWEKRRLTTTNPFTQGSSNPPCSPPEKDDGRTESFKL